eukprot:scaffold12215_cov58-Phaeocystis_antarctica.AAC.2
MLIGLRCGQVDHAYHPIRNMPMPTMPILAYTHYGLRCGQVEHAYYPIRNMPMPTMPILTMACGAGRWTILETGRQPSSCSTGWMDIAHRAPGEPRTGHLVRYVYSNWAGWTSHSGRLVRYVHSKRAGWTSHSGRLVRYVHGKWAGWTSHSARLVSGLDRNRAARLVSTYIVSDTGGGLGGGGEARPRPVRVGDDARQLTTYQLLHARTAPGPVRVGDDARGLARVIGAAEVVEHAWGCMMGAYEYNYRVDTYTYRAIGLVRGGAGGVQWGCSGGAVGLQWGSQRTEQRGRRRVVILGGDDEDGVGVLVRVRMRLRVGAMG